VGEQSGPTILLDAHCDNVGIVTGLSWKHDPFAATLEDGVVYGRGIADMKGALAAMIHAAASLERSNLVGRVAVSATVMEEVMEGISLRAVIEAVRPDFVVIGEATNFNLNRGGRGRAEIHLETIGRPAHSSSPEEGRNAVLDMIGVVRAIGQLPLSIDPLLGPAIMALTDIISDPYPGYSVIPSRCRVTFDRRLLAGESPESVLAALRALPLEAGTELHITIAEGEHRTFTGARLRGPKFFPAWVLPESHPLVQGAYRGLRAEGFEAKMGAYRFCTNAAYSAGVAGIPTIGFGPGSEADAHTIDEHLAAQAIVDAARGYRAIVQAVLGTD
jgi:putative selenium metabolism hydrolase